MTPDVDLEVQNEQLKKTIEFLRDRNAVLDKSRREIKQNYRNMKQTMNYWAERCDVHRKRIAYLELPLWVKIKMYFK